MQTVVGIFDTADEAQDAVNELKNNGFNSDNIDVSYNNDTDYNNYTDRSNDKFSDNYNDRYSTRHEEKGSKVGNFFRNLFGDDDDEANRYSRVASKAGCIVTVHADSAEDAQAAADVLDEYGAMNVDERDAEYGYDDNYDNSNSPDSLKVIKEDVQIGKKEVETGGKRLRSRIIERPVEENLRLRQEKVTVERTPVDRAATDADLRNFKEGQIEMTETSEVADVRKEARVVEEVKLSKNVTHEDKTVKETARDTQVDVEDITKKNVEDITKKNKRNNY
jgi:stress response protein YsnF